MEPEEPFAVSGRFERSSRKFLCDASAREAAGSETAKHGPHSATKDRFRVRRARSLTTVHEKKLVGAEAAVGLDFDGDMRPRRP